MKRQDPRLWEPRNPIAERLSRQQVFRQITIPMIIAIVILLIVIGMAFILPSAGASLWADIALIWMITPTIFLTLIFLAVTGVSIYAIVKLIQGLPPFFYKIQNFTRLVNVRVKEVGERATAPVIKAKTISASTRAVGQAVRSAARRVVNSAKENQ